MTKPFRWNEPSEKDIEKAILYFLNYQIGCFAFKVQTKAHFNPDLGHYVKLNKLVQPGTPDIICCYSVDGLGVFIGFEVKTEKGRQSTDQKTFQQRLEDRANGFYFIIRSVKEAEEALLLVKAKVEASVRTLSAAPSRPRNPA